MRTTPKALIIGFLACLAALGSVGLLLGILPSAPPNLLTVLPAERTTFYLRTNDLRTLKAWMERRIGTTTALEEGMTGPYELATMLQSDQKNVVNILAANGERMLIDTTKVTTNDAASHDRTFVGTHEHPLSSRQLAKAASQAHREATVIWTRLGTSPLPTIKNADDVEILLEAMLGSGSDVLIIGTHGSGRVLIDGSVLPRATAAPLLPLDDAGLHIAAPRAMIQTFLSSVEHRDPSLAEGLRGIMQAALQEESLEDVDALKLSNAPSDDMDAPLVLKVDSGAWTLGLAVPDAPLVLERLRGAAASIMLERIPLLDHRTWTQVTSRSTALPLEEDPGGWVRTALSNDRFVAARDTTLLLGNSHTMIDRQIEIRATDGEHATSIAEIRLPQKLVRSWIDAHLPFLSFGTRAYLDALFGPTDGMLWVRVSSERGIVHLEWRKDELPSHDASQARLDH